ncbi:hypothetical protein OPQ81_000291 [Rhizoctonia solani]|nr:hypothetical protein OPQ81_000291 [Rhizoctonia solani]
MDYAPEDDDPVIWQCSQAVELKRIFADAPVPTAPLPSEPVSGLSTRNGTRAGPHGVKRKRRQDQDVAATSSAETLGLIQQLSRTLGGCRPSNSNPARRNTRIASAGNITFGIPPPKPKPSSSDETSDPGFHPSRSSTTSPLVIGKPIPEFLAPQQNQQYCFLRSWNTPVPNLPELPAPPAPAKPVISIRTDADTVNKPGFSTRLNTLESATSTADSGSFVSTTAPISPATPLYRPPPSPEPKIARKASSRSKSPPVEAPVSKPSTEASRPVTSTARAITEPNPPKRLPTLSSQHAKSSPSHSFKPPTQAAFKPPTQQAFRPPTQTASKPSPTIRPTQQQQNPRTFPSSQSRLGLGALGKGYSGVNKPFKVPNKGKGTIPLTVVPLPRRDSLGVIKAPPSPSRKKENLDAGRAKRGNSPAPAARPSTRPTSGFSSRTPSGSSSRTSSSTARGKPTQSRNTSSSKREPGSDDYIGSDESFDADAVDADMAFWDSWDD